MNISNLLASCNRLELTNGICQIQNVFSKAFVCEDLGFSSMKGARR